MSDVTVASTTDTQQEVNVAAGLAAEAQEQTAQTEQKEQAPEQKAEEQKPETKTEPTKQEAKPAKTPEQKRIDKDQKRIDKLTARNYQLEKERNEFKSRIEALEARTNSQSTTTQAAKADDDPKPTAEQFTKDGKTYEDFVEALSAWRARKEFKTLNSKQETQQTEATQRERLQKTYDTYNQRVSEARGRYEDWDEVVTQSTDPIPQGVIMAIYKFENGPDVAYHLFKNQEARQRLLELDADDPLLAVVEVGRIADQLKAQAGGSAASTEKKEQKTEAGAQQTRKPTAQPIRPVGGNSTRSQSAPMDELPYSEYRRVRDQQEKGRYRA